jgi:hypothetical protein
MSTTSSRFRRRQARSVYRDESIQSTLTTIISVHSDCSPYLQADDMYINAFPRQMGKRFDRDSLMIEHEVHSPVQG